MITINTFNLSLPIEYEHRAQNIINKIGTKLLRFEAKNNLALTEFSLPDLLLTQGMSDDTIAAKIVAAFTQELKLRGGIHD